MNKELQEAEEVQPQEPELQETPAGDELPAEEVEEVEEEEVFVSFGDEEEPQEESEEEEPKKAAKWVKDLRKDYRQARRENRELKAKLEELTKAKEEPIQLGEEPTLESCDYDSELFKSKLLDWSEQKRKHEAEQSKVREKEEQEKQAWQAKLDSYEVRKQELKYPDFEDSEEYVLGKFNQVQKGVILDAADDPAVLVYALGKNEKKVDELLAETNPIKFAVKISKLESKLKVTQRKAKTKTEKVLTGGSSGGGSVDSTLEKLREEAQRTGDYTKVTKYKRKLKAS